MIDSVPVGFTVSRNLKYMRLISDCDGFLLGEHYSFPLRFSSDLVASVQ